MRRLCDHLGVPLPSPVWAELDTVVAALADPGPFLSLVHGDPCPDNTRIYGDRVVLFDFETSALGRALLDAAYIHLCFPTCWCVGTIPSSDMAAMEAAYRAELAPACPPAADDAQWRRAIAHSAVGWLLSNIEHLAGHLSGDDDEWGTASIRQRIVYRAQRTAQLAAQANTLPRVAELAVNLVTGIQQSSPGLTPLPAYPATAFPGQPTVDKPAWWTSRS